MRMQVILDSLFARPGSAPMWGAGRKESSGTGLYVTRSPGYGCTLVQSAAELFRGKRSLKIDVT